MRSKDFQSITLIAPFPRVNYNDHLNDKQNNDKISSFSIQINPLLNSLPHNSPI